MRQSYFRIPDRVGRIAFLMIGGCGATLRNGGWLRPRRVDFLPRFRIEEVRMLLADTGNKPVAASVTSCGVKPVNQAFGSPVLCLTCSTAASTSSGVAIASLPEHGGDSSQRPRRRQFTPVHSRHRAGTVNC